MVIINPLEMLEPHLIFDLVCYYITYSSDKGAATCLEYT